MKLQIVKYPNDVLITPTEEVTIFNGELKLLVEEMLRTMRENNGAGLAANQVGINKRLFVMDEIGGVINPHWKSTISGFQYPCIEACLSFPGWLIPVKRYDCIVAEWQDVDGNNKKAILKQFAAQVFQHETEHLSGLTILEHLTEAQQRTLRNFYKEK